MTNSIWDDRDVEWRFDNFKFFLARKGLYPPVGIYLARMLMQYPLSIFLNSLFIDFIFWSTTMLLINLPIRSTIISSVIILAFQSIVIVIVLIYNVIIRTVRHIIPNKSSPVATSNIRGTRRAVYTILIGLAISVLLVFFRLISTIAALMLLTRITSINILAEISQYANLDILPSYAYIILYAAILIFAVYPILLILISRGALGNDMLSMTVSLLIIYVEPLMFLIISRVVSNIDPHLAVLAVILLVQSLIFPFSFIFSVISSFILTVIRAVLGLVKIRANVLGITFLAAVIPFISADAWQLTTGLKWINLAVISFLVYFLPISLLLYSQRKLIRSEIYNNIWGNSSGGTTGALTQLER